MGEITVIYQPENNSIVVDYGRTGIQAYIVAPLGVRVFYLMARKLTPEGLPTGFHGYISTYYMQPDEDISVVVDMALNRQYVLDAIQQFLSKRTNHGVSHCALEFIRVFPNETF